MRVLLIYTGGTIGMQQLAPSHGYVPVKNFLSGTLSASTRFHDPEALGPALGVQSNGNEKWSVMNAVHVATSYPSFCGGEASPLPPKKQSNDANVINGTPFERRTLPALITPKSIEGKRILYSIFEYETLLDSANMGMADWTRIAIDIELNYSLYDAFVVLHGTDTMAYSAAALSFMLEHLGKTVIITGSQIPLAEVRNDAVENLLGSLMIAGHYTIPEVCLFFGNRLFRGNRSTKQDALDLDAFESPNLDPLAKVGVGISVDWNLVLRPRDLRKFRAHKTMEPRVATLKLFPGIAIETIRAFLTGSIRGIVLETFGAGNAPSNRPDLLAALKEAIHERGIVIVNTTQCRRGSVSDIYETGSWLTAIGVVPGYDMTPECALVKLSYLLSKGLKQDEVASLLKQNLRGELTPAPEHPRNEASPHSDNAGRGGFVEDMLNLVQQTSAKQPSYSAQLDSSDGSFSYPSLDRVPVAETSHEGMERELVPLLLGSCVLRNDVYGLRHLLDRAANQALAAKFSNGKTALHLACQSALPEIVRALLFAGANVHSRDREGHTNLFDALFAVSDGTSSFADRRLECIALLRETGACLAGWVTVTRTLSRRRLSSGAPTSPDRDAQSTSEITDKFRIGEMRDTLWRAFLAASTGDIQLISLLLDCGVDMTRDLIDGRTVLHVASTAGRPDIVRVIAERQLGKGVMMPRDRWGKTPADDAEHGARSAVDEESKMSYAECLAIFAALD